MGKLYEEDEDTERYVDSKDYEVCITCKSTDWVEDIQNGKVWCNDCRDITPKVEILRGDELNDLFYN